MDAAERYLDLLKRMLTRRGFEESYRVFEPRRGSLSGLLSAPARGLFAMLGLRLMRPASPDLSLREEGKDWPADAETMMGLRRMENLQACVTEVLKRGVPGDLIETGVWRGGGTIFMRGILEAYGDRERMVWVADSFEGLPPPNPELYPADRGDLHATFSRLAVTVDDVKANFAKYGLLDDRVRFLVGWFKDTLPRAPIERLAVLRLDGDLYESTMDALGALYPKLSVGGYVIVDDYGALAPCKAAVEDYRAKHGITEAIRMADWTGAYWKRER